MRWVLREPAGERENRGEERECAEFTEFAGMGAMALAAWGKDADEGNAGVASGEGIVNVVAEIERCGGISAIENFQQSFGMGLSLGDIVHGDDAAEVLAPIPLIEGEFQLVAGTAGEDVEFVGGGPLRDLLAGDNHLFVADVAGVIGSAPIEFLEGGAGLSVGGGNAEGGGPGRGHAPVVIVAGLGFPAVELSMSDFFASEVANGFESGLPVGAANVDEDAIHVKDEDFRSGAKFA